ncbi:4-alpha-glucanotransferase [Lysobacter sp. D1-1-M9]|uniref:4-alpha-glucanotransferase n=1 Tax=Novilysobacter longmucuonensis TaxID=3098603 RepID=UPI002FCC800F
MSNATQADLDDLAKRAGISPRWDDFRGKTHEVASDTLRHLLSALELPCDSAGQLADSRARREAASQSRELPPLITAACGEPTVLAGQKLGSNAAFELTLERGGRLGGRLHERDGDAVLPAIDTPGYHHLLIGDTRTTVAVAPRQCIGVPELCGPSSDPSRPPRPWGLAAQLYGLNMPGDGGIGTYGALGHLAARLAHDGAAALAVSPVHAMFSAEPAHCSPYSPSSRLLLNALHVDPREAFGDAAAHAREALGLGSAIARLEADPLIDWKAAGAARLAVLRRLFDEALAMEPALVAAFEQHRRDADAALEDHARFETLHAHFLSEGIWSWRDWPEPYRDPRSAAVERFAHEHVGTVRFHAFLQWLAARGLGKAQRDARSAGMPIGLLADLAIGSDPNGSHVWSRQRETLVGLSIGAPPDELAMRGQVWGLATLSPTAMRETGFSAFIELLRACMRHAGGIRIDHVMGLMRLWLVPEGASPLDGAYLAYPKQDLLRLIALESWRHRCLVVGEDLGTVPAGFGDTLAEAGVLGMSVLWFERDARGGFAPAAAWRSQAIAMTTTHDLPTAAGWWLGRDIEVRRELGLADPGELDEQLAQREDDRDRMWRTIHADRRGDGDSEPPQPESAATAEFVNAAVAHVGRTPAALTLVPVEDVLGLTDTPNVPGTRDEHPNWRRRLPADIDTVFDSQPARQRLSALDVARRGTP